MSPARPVLKFVALGLVLATSLTALLFAVWPASESDKAYDDGHRLGAAVTDLYDADTTYEVNDALTDIREAARDTRIHAGDAVGDQMDAQGDAFAQAANGYLGAISSDDEWDQDVYQSELDSAVDELGSQADDFRSTGTDVQQSFMDGYDDGRSA